MPLLEPARDKAVHGGRGSGKSHFVAELLIEDSLAEPGNSGGEGMRTVCIREVQKDLAQSSKALIEAKLRAFGLTDADGFKVYKDVISAPGDGLFIFKGMNDYTADSIKSLEGFKRGWWEEAHGATQHSINLYRPTMRAAGSQMLWSWNARRKTDPVDAMFRGGQIPTGAIVVAANWRDNPWFTPELEQERLDCLRMQPDQYDHIWEGGYVTVVEGAYYATQINEAKAQNRIGRVSRDPLFRNRIFCDLGGSGARADAFAMWAAQFVGQSILVLDYYESVGQVMGTHARWLEERGYKPDNTDIYLPHDGEQQAGPIDSSWAKEFKKLGYTVVVIPNQGKGAAMQRVKEGRLRFSKCWFNQETTQAGLDALGWYHEKKDDERNIGLGPEHDWSSHGADAYGLMCVAYEEPQQWAPLNYPRLTTA